QVDCDVLSWVDSIIAVGAKLAGGGAQLGGELGSGSAGADDCQVQLLRLELFGLPLRTKEGIEQPLIESFGLACAVQQDRMLANTWSTEVVTETADGDDQRVVGEETSPHHFASLVVEIRGEHDLALIAVEPDQFPDTIVEVVPMGLSPEFRLLHLKFHAARCDLMQQRFPEVGPRLVDQRPISNAAPTERVAEACDQFKASGAAADDDDAMRGAVTACHIDYHLTASITGRSANLFPFVCSGL